jgi:hypothetical protein
MLSCKQGRTQQHTYRTQKTIPAHGVIIIKQASAARQNNIS